MFVFEPKKYGPAVERLLASAPLNELGPGGPISSLSSELSALTAENITAPRKIADRDMASSCLAGLWLVFDFLDDSHKICQDIDTATGGYWHAIMHRREPDFANSKYWFRQVGEHEVFAALCDEARRLAADHECDAAAKFLAEQASWDPYRFVDLCEAATRGRRVNEQLCRRVAQLEWRILFDYSYRCAVNG